MKIFAGKILLTTGGSEEAELAARTAIDLAESTGSEMDVVYVEPLPNFLDRLGTIGYDRALREKLEAAGTEDPVVDRAVIERGGLRMTMVAVPEKSAVVQVAVELVDGGAQSIELCGAFGLAWTARVIEAIGGCVPVGSVRYSMESVPGLGLAALFASAT